MRSIHAQIILYYIILVQQQVQTDPSDVVVQHLQQQALNWSQLNDILSSILSSQQNLQ